MQSLEIGEVARRAEMQTSAIRYYESRGLLPAPRRVNGRRRYSPDILERLFVIRAARQLGFTLAEIGVLLDGFAPGTPPRERWQAFAGAKLARLQEQIARAQQVKQMLEKTLCCECRTLEECTTVLPSASAGG